MSTDVATTPTFEQVDSRGPRFTATVTATVLLTVLVVSMFSAPAATAILAAQSLVFAIGAAWGPRRHPYGATYRKLVAPRLGPATKREGVPPLRFAQLMGFIVTAIGVTGFALGVPAVGVGATSVAFIVAFVRAAFGICLNRKLFALIAHLRGKELRPCCKAE
ncbi:MAG: DUF4395 domain-containing protein [Mycobacterium sp.]|nr:DUF4395 domain-containing protein [Mycobacterium sp.]